MESDCRHNSLKVATLPCKGRAAAMAIHVHRSQYRHPSGNSYPLLVLVLSLALGVTKRISRYTCTAQLYRVRSGSHAALLPWLAHTDDDVDSLTVKISARSATNGKKADRLSHPAGEGETYSRCCSTNRSIPNRYERYRRTEFQSDSWDPFRYNRG